MELESLGIGGIAVRKFIDHLKSVNGWCLIVEDLDLFGNRINLFSGIDDRSKWPVPETGILQVKIEIFPG